MTSLALHFKAQNLSVITTREPGGCPLGESVRDLLLHNQVHSSRAETLLFLAARAEHVKTVIEPALKQGSIVLCDRFTDSSLAYQGAARALDIDSFCQFAAHNLTPDLTFLLDLDPQIGLQRASGEKDRLEQEAITFHEKVRQGYLNLAQKDPKRIHIIDATKSPEKVLQEALCHL